MTSRLERMVLGVCIGLAMIYIGISSFSFLSTALSTVLLVLLIGVLGLGHR